jgi:hypothetical protein
LRAARAEIVTHLPVDQKQLGRIYAVGGFDGSDNLDKVEV